MANSVGPDSFQAIGAHLLAPTPDRLPLVLRPGSLGLESGTNLYQMGSIAVSEADQGWISGRVSTETTTSEHSSCVVAEGPTAAGGDACVSVCSDSPFFATDHYYDSSLVPLAFCTANGVEIPIVEQAAGSSPAEVDAIAAQLNNLDTDSCGKATKVETALEAASLHVQEEQLSLYPHFQQHRPYGRNEKIGVSAKKQHWSANRDKETNGLGLFHGTSGQRLPQEGQRNRCRSYPITPKQGGKSKTGDTTDQVYKLGLLLRQLGRLGKVRSCWEIWQETVNTEGLKPNAVSYGCILDALVSNGALDLALKLLAEMKASNQAIRPNTVMYSTLIKGCAQSKQLDQALALFDEMAAQGVEVNTVTYNSLLDVCARVGAMDRAATLLDDMLKKGIKPDLITFSTIIKGYCADGQMDKALLLLKAMKQKSISPDGVLYNSLLDGCVRAGRSSLCLELWREMQAQKIRPSNFTLSILIKLHGRMRQLQVAFELVKQFPKIYDFKLNAHVYTCLMAACIENRQYQAAYNVLQKMRHDGVAADSKTVSTIVFGCLKGRMHAQAVEVVLNALESLRDRNPRGQSRQSQRGRQGAGGSSRKQLLPAIDEKTVRFLAYHLRDQHMHQECTLVLDTAVAVGLMTRSAAQSLLAGEGNGERKHPPSKSKAPAGFIPLSHPVGRNTHPSGKIPLTSVRHIVPRVGHQQGSALMHEPGSGLRHPVLSGEYPRRSGHSGAREEYMPPAVAQSEGDGYLTFYANAHHQDQHSSTSHDQRLGQKAQLYALTSEPQAAYHLQQGMESQRPLSARPIVQTHLHCTALQKEALLQHLPPPAIDGASRGGNRERSVPAFMYDRTIAACRSSTERLSLCCAEEGVAAQRSELQCTQCDQAWTSPVFGAPLFPIGSSFPEVPSLLNPSTPPHTMAHFNDISRTLDVRGSFGHEDNCRLPGLPLS